MPVRIKLPYVIYLSYSHFNLKLHGALVLLFMILKFPCCGFFRSSSILTHVLILLCISIIRMPYVLVVYGYDRKRLKGGGLISAHSLWGQLIMVAEGHVRSGCIHCQGAERSKCWFPGGESPFSFLLSPGPSPWDTAARLEDGPFPSLVT